MATKEIQLDELKARLRKEIIKRYGSVPTFLRSEDGQKFGGLKIKSYLYPAGATSFKTLQGLSEFLGVGSLTRQLVIKRTVIYYLNK